jgi:chaperone modulatory protein CbpM
MNDPLDGEIADGMTLTLTELCVRVGAHADLVVELVSCGVVVARGASQDEWAFDLRALERSRAALRLHRDLGLDWRNLALTLDLLEEVERLRRRVDLLERLHGAGGT